MKTYNVLRGSGQFNVLIIDWPHSSQALLHHKLMCHPFPDVATMTIIHHSGNHYQQASNKPSHDATGDCTCVAFGRSRMDRCCRCTGWGTAGRIGRRCKFKCAATRAPCGILGGDVERPIRHSQSLPSSICVFRKHP